MNTDFNEWLKLVDAEAKKCGHTTNYTEETGPEAWRGYFDDGYTPRVQAPGVA